MPPQHNEIAPPATGKLNIHVTNIPENEGKEQPPRLASGAAQHGWLLNGESTTADEQREEKVAVLDEDGNDLLDIRPERIHQKSTVFMGSPGDMDELKKYL